MLRFSLTFKNGKVVVEDDEGAIDGGAGRINKKLFSPLTNKIFGQITFFFFLLYCLFEISLPAFCFGCAFVCANLPIFPLPISNFLPVGLIYKKSKGLAPPDYLKSKVKQRKKGFFRGMSLLVTRESTLLRSPLEIPPLQQHC